MKNGKRPQRKKWIALGVAAAVIIVGCVAYSVMKINKNTLDLKKDAVVTIAQADMTAVFSAPATVESGNQGVFDILDGTLVKQVNVRVGDSVKKGDVLATFNASSLNGMLEQKRKDFDSAKKAYQDYLKSMAEAPKREASLKARIAELEDSIAEMQKKNIDNAQNPAEKENAQLKQLKNSIAMLLGNTTLANNVVNTVFRENGSIAQTMKVFQDLLSGSFFTGTGNLAEMLGSISSLTNPELMSSSLELIQLKVQESMIGLQSGTSLESLYKTLSDSAEKAYAQAQETVKTLKSGWVAQYDGIIRDVNVEDGEVYQSAQTKNSVASNINVTSLLASLSAGQADISTLLSGLFSNTVSGMTVEYYPFTASFLLGKYDISKISLDQKVRVTSITGEKFDGVVTYISPVAKEGSEINISSLLGSGGTAKGVEARITIPQPDKSITIGLDVDVEIDLETRRDVLQAPVESIRYDEEAKQSYVMIYNEKSRTIHKQYVEMGLFDGTNYEITKGLAAGDRIMRAPQPTWADGQRVRLG
ncbi:MAG: biotin/lipoyl-binding protein [Oscillospiraceae bacterium]|jgi:HlyD family secretion protein|nr:biotin/lipoyl-binding protein [Oscillospiraceae bacterium]